MFFFSTCLIFLFFWCISNEVKSVNVWILSGVNYCGQTPLRSRGSAIYVVLNATYSRIMYLIIILTIEINNNNNNKNDIVWLIISLFFFSQSAAMCRWTWRKEVIIYVLHSFKCYLHENLDLIIIFFTLLQFFLFNCKTMYFSKYYHCSSFRLFWYFCFSGV